MTSSAIIVRVAGKEDFDTILALNLESEHFLSPIDLSRLSRLHTQAAYHRVAELDSHVVGFLLALREGVDYDSPNYRWFADAYDAFLYVDRVVVSRAHQGNRIGAALYDDLFEFARRHRIDRVVCEFDVHPPNEASQRFHARYGFTEVGTQWVAEGKKQVSLQLSLTESKLA